MKLSFRPAVNDPGRAIGIIGGALPILFLQYVGAVGLYHAEQELEGGDPERFWTDPLIAHQPVIIAVGFSLLLIYAVKVYDFFRERQPMEVIESALRYQAMLICALGLVGVLTAVAVYAIAGGEVGPWVLAVVGIVRIAVEPLVDKFRVREEH